jgi:hypothetical protein
MQVFIPSKNRAQTRRKNPIWIRLPQHGIPVTLVVEPAQFDSYHAAKTERAAQLGPHGASALTIAVLPEDDQGIGYARQYVLRSLARPTSWVIMIDDDIGALGWVCPIKKQWVPDVDPPVWFDEFFRSISETRCDPAVVVFGVTPAVVACHHVEGNEVPSPRVNGPTNVIIAFRPLDIPLSVRYDRLKMREDVDFVLQLQQLHLRSVQYRHLAFAAPSMGASGPGGMTDSYRDLNFVEEQNREFKKLWPFVVKAGRVDDSATVPDVCVNWKQIIQSGNENTTSSLLVPQEELMVLRRRAVRRRPGDE